MKNIFFGFIVVSLLLTPAFQASAQSNNNSTFFNMDGFPQWSKDLRRWEIIAFGTFPFALFVTTFAADMYRWGTEANFDFSDQGRRYAPWPFKSAGAADMTNREHEIVFIASASLSAVLAFVDMIIVLAKRNRDRRYAESLPAGTTIITRTPYQTGEPEPDSGGAQQGETQTDLP
jgi:hypothetical protein